MQNFYIKTFGCKLNQYESETIRETLLNNSLIEITRPVKEPKIDLFIINCCVVTYNSEKKIVKYIRRIFKKYAIKELIVIGCITSELSDKIKEYNNSIKIYKKSRKFDFLKELELKQNNTKYICELGKHSRAFVKIQDGCNSKCSYCIVPLMRGKSVSRNKSDIITEISKLSENGYKEIVLTGVHIAQYNYNDIKLHNLIKEIIHTNGDFRVRLSSLNINEIDDNIVGLLKNKKICNHLHLSIQSGSDKILKLMNRNYTFDNIVNKIKKIYEMNNNVVFTTDIIIGFPGETDKEFNQTVKLLNYIPNLYWIHIFPFSFRPGTEVINKTDDYKINNDIITARKKQLMDIILKKRNKLYIKYKNKIFECINESTSMKNILRADNYFKIIVKKNTMKNIDKNSFYYVRLKNISNKEFIGEIV